MNQLNKLDIKVDKLDIKVDKLQNSYVKVIEKTHEIESNHLKYCGGGESVNKQFKIKNKEISDLNERIRDLQKNHTDDQENMKKITEAQIHNAAELVKIKAKDSELVRTITELRVMIQALQKLHKNDEEKKSCESEWKEWQGHCYYFGTRLLSWQEAKVRIFKILCFMFC